MKPEKNNFRHESLQDLESIQGLLKAITRGLGKGKLELSDEDGEITLRPEGLLNLKITASQEAHRDRLNIRITWQKPVDESKTGKQLKISDK